MSYILDALKKAEGERQLGRAPGIHTPLAEQRAKSRTPARIHVLAWSIGLVALVVALTLWWSRDQTGAVVPAVTAAPPETAVTTTQAPPLAAAPRSGVPSVPRAEVGAGGIADAKPAQKTGSVQKPESIEEARSSEGPGAEARTGSGQETNPAATAPATSPKRKVAPHAASPARRQDASAETAAAVPVKPVPPDAKPVVALAALPPEIRGQIPAFTITGYLYAGSRAERSILIDNRLMHEGDLVAAGLVLEEMRPSQAIFSYRGTRFSMPYR
jgi:general secretion pathway protein B